MERKNNFKPNLGAVSKISVPFYEPRTRQTSADIINEARSVLKESKVTDNSFTSTVLRPLQTQRPFTPKESERILFGKKNKNRPPSSFSLHYLQSDIYLNESSNEEHDVLTPASISTLNTNVTSNIKLHKYQRSNSIAEINDNKIFNVGLNIRKVKLPALDILKPLQKRKQYKSTYSLDNLPEEHEPVQQNAFESRNAFSSPQERTDFGDNLKLESPFGRPSKQQNLSRCLILGPQNLFDNKQIVENSQTLFVKTGYFNNYLSNKYEVKDTTQSSSDKPLKKRTINDVIKRLNYESNKRNNEELINTLLNEMYEFVDKDNLLNVKISSKMKIDILKCLYKYVESQNEELLLHIARVILALKVTGNNLSGVCKVIFKVSKNDKNDHLFFQQNILDLFIDALGRSSPFDDAEACVYGYGSIKFLTMNVKLLERILSLGILQLMVLHIKLINNARIEKSQMPEQTNHALFQLTGALRNLVSDNMYQEFILSGAIYQLCQTIDIFSPDLDVVSNISRTLSKLSTNEECCTEITHYQNIYKILVRLFEKYPGNEEIIVRLAYTLGNIVSNLDTARTEFYQEDDSIKSLINIWKIYLERTLKSCSMRLEEKNKRSENEDVMIKIIRIVANIAINPDIGKAMNDQYGTQLIDEFLKVLISNPFKKNEELVLSVLSTLNNLSYYYTTDFIQNIFQVKHIDIMEGISEYLRSKNKECRMEAIRILGNLSRSKVTRNYIAETEHFNKLLDILEKSDIDLLKTTTGVFVNLMADNKNRTLFKNNGGTCKLINILNNHGQYDWSLSMLVCQVLWNYCIECVNLYDFISDGEIQQLMAVLADYLDEERLFGITDPNEDEEIYTTPEYIVWEEFANVATNLLEKIEHFLDTLEQINLNKCSDDENLGIPKSRDSSTNISFTAW